MLRSGIPPGTGTRASGQQNGCGQHRRRPGNGGCLRRGCSLIELLTPQPQSPRKLEQCRHLFRSGPDLLFRSLMGNFVLRSCSTERSNLCPSVSPHELTVSALVYPHPTDGRPYSWTFYIFVEWYICLPSSEFRNSIDIGTINLRLNFVCCGICVDT